MTTVENRRFLADARGNISDPEVAKRPRPVPYAATVGALLLAFELVVLGRWVLGSHFTTTPTGPDQISSGDDHIVHVTTSSDGRRYSHDIDTHLVILTNVRKPLIPSPH